MKNNHCFLILLLTVLLCGKAFPQEFKSDFIKKCPGRLNELMVKSVGLGTNLYIGYCSSAFDKKLRPSNERPGSQKELDSLRSKLDGSDKDGPRHFRIGNILKGFGKNDKASIEFKASNLDLSKLSEKDPKNKDWPMEMAINYMQLADWGNGKKYLNRVLELDSNDENAKWTILMLPMFAGDFKGAESDLSAFINNAPDSASTYYFLPLLRFYEFYAFMTANSNDDSLFVRYRNKPIDSVIDIAVLKQAWKRTNTFEMEYVYRVAQSMGINLKLVMNLTLHNGYFEKHHRYYTDSADIATLHELEDFFRRAIARKDYSNKFYMYKGLADAVAVLEGPDKAIGYMRKSIDLKPSWTWGSMDNVNGNYDDLAVLYLLKGDTGMAEKITEEKIKLKPSLYPSVDDYYALATYKIHDHKYSKARELNAMALSIDSTSEKALKVRILIDLLENNLKLAKLDLDKFFKTAPNNTSLLLWQAYVSIAEKDASTASYALKRALEQEAIDKKTYNDLVKEIFVEKN